MKNRKNGKMKLILFIHKEASDKGADLEKTIYDSFDTIEIESYTSFAALEAGVKKAARSTEEEIFILLAESVSRLNELTRLIDLLEGKRVVLILPDESKATLTKAFGFFPRFFTTVNDDFHNLSRVLHKMISRR